MRYLRDVWQSFDGVLFDDQGRCKQHEDRLRDLCEADRLDGLRDDLVTKQDFEAAANARNKCHALRKKWGFQP